MSGKGKANNKAKTRKSPKKDRILRQRKVVSSTDPNPNMEEVIVDYNEEDSDAQSGSQSDNQSDIQSENDNPVVLDENDDTPRFLNKSS